MRTEKREISGGPQLWRNNNISLLFRDTSYIYYQSCKIFGIVLLEFFNLGFKPMMINIANQLMYFNFMKINKDHL